MKKLFLFLFIYLYATFQSYSQISEKVIDEGIYKCYFSYSMKDPLYVVYHLYEGGGRCSRKGLRFKAFQGTACGADYSHSGYDEGHLANAEDFAGDCDNEKKTFEFYNCLPQTPRLNRGIWKSWETKIREESQATHLLIICGGIFGKETIGNNVHIPIYCWKIVFNADNMKLLHCLIFKNDSSDSYNQISLEDLKSKLGYNLIFSNN